MKKNLCNGLIGLIIVFICSFIMINGASAATTLTIKSYDAYKATYYDFSGWHTWGISNGATAFCFQAGIKGPRAGDKLTCNAFSGAKANGALYIFDRNVDNYTNGRKSSSAEIKAIRQSALWCYLNGVCSRGNAKIQQITKQITADAKNNENYTHEPKVSIGTLTPTLVNGESYYETNLIKPSLSFINGNYSVTATGVSDVKILNKDNKVVSSLSPSESFKVRVPSSSLKESTKVTVSVNATGTRKTILRCVPVKKGLQPLGMPITTTNVKAVTAKTTFNVDPTTVIVNKVDSETNTPLAGAQYKIYSDASCNNSVPGHTLTYTTLTNGSVSIYGLSNGTYYVKEINPPAGYDNVIGSNCVSVKTGASVTFKNAKNSVQLIKQDANGNKLKGAIFALYNNKTCTDRAKNAITGKNFDFAESNANGEVVFRGVSSANHNDENTNFYYLKEITPPAGYLELPANQNCKPVMINGAPITFVNTRISEDEIAIQKRDKYTNYGIGGVPIGLFTDSSCSNKIDEGETSAGGQIRFNVQYGEGNQPTYYVKELSIPTGYVSASGNNISECKSIKVGVNNNSLIIYNRPYGDIKLLKTEIDSNKLLEGVEFKLLDEDKNEVTSIEGVKVANQKTNSEGNLEFKNILYGTYYLKEVSNGGKYKLSKEPIKFVLNSSTDSIKLATYGSDTYKLGDANGDSIINEQDLMIYQNVIEDPDTLLGLPPKVNHAMDINGSGNITASDVEVDMKILEYYLKFSNSLDSTSLIAARNYMTKISDFCNLVGSSYCNIDNLNFILDMYNANKDQLASYANDYTLWQTSHSEWISDHAEWEIRQNEYNTNCSNPEIPGEGEPPLENSYDCTQDIGEEPVEPLLSNVCGMYSMLGDLDHDCSIDNDDIDLLEDAIGSGTSIVGGDFNNDGAINNKDKDILNRYVNFKGRDNSNAIFLLINEIVTNKSLLCDDSTANCSIDTNLLLLAINKVGKSAALPSSIAKASINITNELINMKISKFQISKSMEIEGAEIVIRDSENKKFLEYTSTKESKEFYIPAGKYTLIEKVAPKGYKSLTTTISFEIKEDGSVKLSGAKSNLYTIKKNTSNHLIIYNELIKNKKVKVPNTASNIAILSTLTGVVLVVGGGYFIYKRLK